MSEIDREVCDLIDEVIAEIRRLSKQIEQINRKLEARTKRSICERDEEEDESALNEPE